MSGDILACLGHTDWHYFEPCKHDIGAGFKQSVGGASINNIEVSASRMDADTVRSIVGPSTVVCSPISEPLLN